MTLRFTTSSEYKQHTKALALRTWNRRGGEWKDLQKVGRVEGVRRLSTREAAHVVSMPKRWRPRPAFARGRLFHEPFAL